MSGISIRGVEKSYRKTQVVHGVDLEILAGEFVVILGPSGCGKSTLLRMIAGLEQISGGEIAIDGRVVNKLEPRERGCAMVFQNYALYPHMSVAENIGYALKVAGMPKAERDKKIAEVAKIVDLEQYLDRKPGALSGGQRQRVAMGRAIVREPGVFLFDEPLSNLDAKLRVHMRAEIRRLHLRLKATSVFVTHDQVEAMTLADKLVVMAGGRIEQVGTPAEVYKRPATRFVASFVGAPPMNLIEGHLGADDLFIIDGQRKLPVGSGVGAHLSGTRVTLGIRPEEARLVRPGAPGSLAGIVDFIEELGASRVVHVKLGEIVVAVLVTDETDLVSGARTGVELPTRSLHFFSLETGRRVDTVVERIPETV